MLICCIEDTLLRNTLEYPTHQKRGSFVHTCDVATLFADIADDSALRALRPPAPPTTSAGSDFSLPGDAPTYAPDRPADVRHMDIDVRLDFATQSITGD